MKRFDRAIKCLQDEVYKITGKVAHDAVERGHTPAYCTKVSQVNYLKEAIKILTEHERNKCV